MLKNLFKKFSGEVTDIVEAPTRKQEPVIDSKFIKEDINKRLGYVLQKHNINLTKESQIDVLKGQIEALKKENKPILRKIEQLNNLGFSSTPTNTKVLEQLKKRELDIQVKIDDIKKRIYEANNYNKMVAEYGLKYPGYRFVDKNTMLDVMRRYDLYLADNCFYGKEVPQEALDIISNFQGEINGSRERIDLIYEYGKFELQDDKKRKSIFDYQEMEREMQYVGSVDPSRYIMRDSTAYVGYVKRQYRSQKGSHVSATFNIPEKIEEYSYFRNMNIGHFTASKLKMIAPSSHFNIPQIMLTSSRGEGTSTGYLFEFNKDTRVMDLNQKLAKEFQKKEREVLDPIACLEVEGGYIVLHAWDKEAEIPEIKNPNLN